MDLEYNSDMKLKLVSDLHLEFADLTIENDKNYDCLILGGDICVAQYLNHDSTLGLKFHNFFAQCSAAFPHVVYIMGNHEFYNGMFFSSIDHMRGELSKYSNIYMLELETKVIDDIVFVGGTLWTDMNRRDPLTMHAIEDLMNDFHIIHNDFRNYVRLSALDTVIRHEQTLKYFNHVLSENKDKKCVVVGHHSPSFKSCNTKYSENLMNGGFHSDLSEFILDHPQVVLWTHGHTHDRYDYMIGDTRIVCNPRGYPRERSGWNPNIVLEI